MAPIFYAFIILLFIAVVLGFEGLYEWWNSRHGFAAKRIESRIRAMSAGGQVNRENLTILKQRMLSQSPQIEQILMRLPRVHSLDLLLQQAGTNWSVARLIGTCLALPPLVLALATFAPLPLSASAVVAVSAAALPILHVLRRRRKRMNKLERQLPEVCDMMARAMRSGHAFSGAIGLVGTDFPEPMSGEFRVTFDEINYGVSLNDALLNLAARVPIRDLRYFVIAVLIQRETGGNLAELLESIGTLVRERFKLFDKVRVLSAEGKMSAWVLGLLPFGTAGVMMVVNPTFLEPLWRDPAGLKMLSIVAGSMTSGVLWMRRIVRIRV